MHRFLVAALFLTALAPGLRAEEPAPAGDPGLVVQAEAAVEANRIRVADAADMQAFMAEVLAAHWDLGQAARVDGLVLRRDAAVITLTGFVFRMQPVRGLVTSAQFFGRGRFELTPPIAMERQQVKRFLGRENVDAAFLSAGFSLDDRASQSWFDALEYTAAAAVEAKTLAATTRKGREWLDDAQREGAGKLGEDERDQREFGRVEMARQTYNRLLWPDFEGGVDVAMELELPAGTDTTRSHLVRLGFGHSPLAPEEEVRVWGAWNHGKQDQEAYSTISEFHQGTEHAGPSEYAGTSDVIEAHDKGLVRMVSVDLRMRFTPSETPDVHMLANMVLEATRDDLRIVNFSMTPRLHVTRATIDGKEAPHVHPAIPGSSFHARRASLPLPRPLGKGERIEVRLELEGGILKNYDGLTYIIQEEDQWFPHPDAAGRPALFDTTLVVPKTFMAAASGTPQPCRDEDASAGGECFRFVTNVPVRLVTFNLGRGLKTDAGTALDGTPVTVYTNYQTKSPFEFYDPNGRLVKREYSLSAMGPAIVNKARAALATYTNWFGPFPYEDLKLTPHPKPHGRGFASLLLLYDRSFLSEGNQNEIQTEIGGPSSPPWATDDFISHEIAHQWWGGAVFWKSSRDQWFSEGFANYSALLALAERDRAMQTDWMTGALRDWHDDLTKDEGYIHTIAPLSLGNRYTSAENRRGYEWDRQTFMYEKGGFVMHMLRTVARALKQDPEQGDALFKQAWRGFIDQYRNGAPSNLDMERSIAATYGMKLDWFFKQWVHGLGMPKLTFAHEVVENPAGGFLLRGRIHQADTSFVFPVSVTLHFGKGKTAQESHFYAWVRQADESFEVPLPARPTAVTLNDDLGVLATVTPVAWAAPK